MPPVYRGPFRKEQAERLLWRAGYGPRPAERPAAARRPRQAARAARPLGPRPALVARPDGAHDQAAARADDARLARLVRDLPRRRRLRTADAAPEPALPAH